MVVRRQRVNVPTVLVRIQLTVWASSGVCFLPDRDSRLLFVTLWPLDKCQADDNSLGRRQVTLRH